jgi:hypothetical protein
MRVEHLGLIALWWFVSQSDFSSFPMKTFNPFTMDSKIILEAARGMLDGQPKAIVSLPVHDIFPPCVPATSTTCPCCQSREVKFRA